MNRPEIDTFILHETTRGAPDSPEELAYRRGFETGGTALRPRALVGEPGPAVRRLLAPVGPRRFAEEHFGRTVVHLSEGRPDRFESLFSFRRMAELIASRGLPPEQIDVFTASRSRVPRSEYTYAHATRGGLWLDQDALIDRVLRQRGSMVLNALSSHDLGLSELAGELHAWTGQRVKINAYLTPRFGKTFGWHWDGHDVFIFQVEGRKRWCLFEPAMQYPLADGSAAEFRELYERRTPPREEVILERGDVLYVPGGVPHDVYALDQDSLHLSVGLSPIRWADVARASFEAALREELRRVATRTPADPAGRQSFDTLVGRLGDAMRAQELHDLFGAASREQGQESIAATARRWAWFLAPREITPDAVLRIGQPSSRVTAGQGLVVLHVGERVLVLHSAANAAASVLVARGAVRVDELAELSPDEQRRFAATLVEHGVATIEPSKVETSE